MSEYLSKPQSSSIITIEELDRIEEFERRKKLELKKQREKEEIFFTEKEAIQRLISTSPKLALKYKKLEEKLCTGSPWATTYATSFRKGAARFPPMSAYSKAADLLETSSCSEATESDIWPFHERPGNEEEIWFDSVVNLGVKTSDDTDLTFPMHPKEKKQIEKRDKGVKSKSFESVMTRETSEKVIEKACAQLKKSKNY